MKLEEYKVILEREGFRRYGDAYWHGENIFALIVIAGYTSLIILPDFNFDEEEKKWCTYINVKTPYFELTNKFINCSGTEEELMILINVFKKNQKRARVEDKKRIISKDFQGE